MMRDPFDLLDRLLNRTPKPDAKKSANVEGIERVLAHLHQVPKGWRLYGEWAGRYDGDLVCRCYMAVVVTLGKVVEDWPKPRQVAQRYVCAGCGLGVEAANKRFADCVSDGFAERLGVPPPASTSPPSIGAFQQAIMQQQAQLAHNLRAQLGALPSTPLWTTIETTEEDK